MTHVTNIPHVMQHGIVHADSPQANPNFKPIGDASLISARSSFKLNDGRRLGEYIPFYFGARTPMLYVIQYGLNSVVPLPAEEIVYCITSIQKILDYNLDFVFTDGHAVDRFSRQYGIDDVKNLSSILDFDAIKAKYWRNDNDLDLKRRKEAEFLVLGDIPKDAVLGFVVANVVAESRLKAMGITDNMITVRSAFYF